MGRAFGGLAGGLGCYEFVPIKASNRLIKAYCLGLLVVLVSLGQLPGLVGDLVWGSRPLFRGK